MPDPRMDFARKLLTDDPNLNDDDLAAALKIYDAHAQAGPEKARTWLDTAKDLGIGVAKGVGSTVAGIGEMAANAGMVPGVTPSLLNPAMRSPVLRRAEEVTTATNTPQRVGKVLETAAELAVPAAEAVKAIPSAARSGQLFQAVKTAAKDVPVNLQEPGNVALRIVDLAQRGGGTTFGPGPVRQFVQWATDPNKAPMTYEIAKDFASNISRLSVDETRKLAPQLQYEIGNLRVALNKAVGEAAAKAGKGAEYAQAMTEYAKAMRFRDAMGQVLQGAKQAIPYAAKGAALGVGGTGAYWLTKTLLGGGGGE